MLIDKLLERVESLELSLKGKVVLTEAASGAYSVTSILAALAGAKVFAYSRDTNYGTTKEVFGNIKKVLESYEGPQLNIEFIETLTPDVIALADIITNSGHLRPLDEKKLQYAKDGVVIPLMYEAWEWRDTDMDIQYIRNRGIKVGATNERHPEIDVFNYLGEMAVKQIFDAGLCLHKNRFLLVCNNDFGPYIAKVVGRLCDSLGVIDKEENKSKYQFENVEWVGNFPDIPISHKFRNAEAVIFTAYPFDKMWIGKDAPISVSDISKAIKNPFILRYAGDIDSNALIAEGIRYFPENVRSGHMGVLPSAIGYDPIIRLQAGGLKVGEALISGNHTYKNIPVLDLV